jgi:hypothetical protein
LYKGNLESGFNSLNAAQLQFRYNAKKQLIEKTSFDDQKKVIARKTFVYKKDRLYEERHYTAQNKLNEIILYKYNSKGNLLERSFRNAKGRLTDNRLGYARRIFSYNKAQQVTEEVVKKASGTTMRKMVYRYNDQDQKIETIIKDNSGQVTERLQFKYSSNGNIAEKITLNNFRYVKQRLLYKYDNQGLIVEERTLDGNNDLLGDMFDVAVVKRKYGQSQNIIEEKRYNSNNTLKSQVWFDPYEQLLKRQEYNRKQQLLLVVERSYDSFGNILEENTFKVTLKNKKRVLAERKTYKQGQMDFMAEYNKYGHIECEKHYRNGRLHKTRYFNRQGKLIKEE